MVILAIAYRSGTGRFRGRRVAQYVRDAGAPLLQTTQPDPDGAGSLVAPETEYVYDAAARLTQVVDPLDKTTSYQYDALGRMTKLTQPDPDGAGPLTAPETEYVYDSAGQLVETIDPLDHVTTLEYDTLGRQVKVTQPDPDGAGAQLAPWTVFIFDAAGRLVSQTDRLGHATAYAYDNLGRTTSQTDAEDGTTAFTYDAVGNRLTLTDPEDNTTTWEYDALDRVIEETNELSDTRYFSYDAGSFLTRQVDRLGRVRQFEYDHLRRKTAEIWYDDTTNADADQNRQRTFEFAYDARGQLLIAEDADASYEYAYDALGRATSIVQSISGLTPSVTFTQQFDAAGHRTQLAGRVNGTDDFVNDYVFDAIGRTTRIEQHGVTGGKAVAPKRVDFGYDAAGRTTDLTRYADLSGTQLVADTDYGYDFAGRLTDLTHFRGGTTFADYDSAFDAAARMTQFVSSVDGTADYTNDDAGQLTGADYDYQADESYVYDSNGNRTNNGYTVGANNRMTSDGTYAYLYDAEGNRTRRFIDTNANGLLDSGDTNITEYAWDHRNRLTTITHRSQYSAAADQIIEYAYDYANRWVRKELDSDGDSTAEFRQVFAYDGNQIVLDFHREGSENLTIGHLRQRYLWGPAVDQIFAEEAVDGGTADMVLWTLTDHLNTVRDLAQYDPLTDATTVVNHLVYDAFGRVTTETNSAIASLILFTGRPFDEGTALQNNLNRWYDTATGGWASTDAIRTDSNLYRYCGNSPTIATDPAGLVFITGGPMPQQFETVLAHGELRRLMDANYREVRAKYLDGRKEPKCTGKDRLGRPKWIEWRKTTLGEQDPLLPDPTLGQRYVATFSETLEFDLMSRRWEGLLKTDRGYKVSIGSPIPTTTVEWNANTTWYVSGTLAARQRIQVLWQEYHCCECVYGNFDPWGDWPGLGTIPTGKSCGPWIKYYTDVKDLGPTYGWTELAYREGETMVTITGISIAGWGGKE